MRGYVKKDDVVMNIVVLPEGWTGAEGEWQPPKGCVVEIDTGGRPAKFISPVSVEVKTQRAFQLLLDFVARLPDAPQELKDLVRIEKGEDGGQKKPDV